MLHRPAGTGQPDDREAPAVAPGRPTAHVGGSAFQRLIVLLPLCLGVVLIAAEPSAAWLTFSLLLLLLFALIVACKLLTVLAGLVWHDVETPAPAIASAVGGSVADWPVYTVLVPLYHEAAVVLDLLAALERLEYPRERLEVLLLVESDDAATAAALGDHSLPAWLRVLSVPPGEPRTKPRACNLGLAAARGEFLVIFDAEDRPDPDQLKKAVAVFRQVPSRVACLQARLDFYNATQNLLTRWFTLEYITWFDLYLPGLHTLGAPIPLGGTSNHFRTAVLREIGGWDAWNVTEDCDLGVCLARRGAETRIMDSTTWEEATSELGPWLRQRSRWVKGYWQTLVAHTREPGPALRELGVWQLFQFLVVVGGQVLSLVLNPVSWGLLLLWLWWRWAVFCPEMPVTAWFAVAALVMLLCNGVFVVVHALGAVQRRRAGLLGAALLLPVYWLVMSVGAWRGVLQFFTRPFLWEKTPHGLRGVSGRLPSTSAAGAVATPAMARMPRRAGALSRAVRWQMLVVLLLLAVLIGWFGAMTPRWLQFDRQVRLANLSMNRPASEVIRNLDVSWFGMTQLQVAVDLPAASGPPPTEVLYKAVVYLKVLDWEWYQVTASDCRRDGQRLLVSVPLVGNWEPRQTRRPWGPWCLRRVRSLGVRVFSEEKDLGLVGVRGAVVTEEQVPPPLVALHVSEPPQPRQYALGEIRFELSREYRNPFEPREIDVTATVRTPAGEELPVTGFYGQDYRRFHGPVNAEVLVADGAPYWAIRYTPLQPGHYEWRLHARDGRGAVLEQPLPPWEVVAAPGSHGLVRVDAKDPRYFSFDNGRFFYPLAINLRSPGDKLQPRNHDYKTPADTEGTWAMEAYLDRMNRAGITMARVWSSSWFGGLEWNRQVPGYHGLGVYNLQNAWRLDCLLDLARDRGIWLEFALQNHGPFTFQYDIQWPDNPFNRALGGPLHQPQDVLTDPEAIRFFKNRIRYLAARYGAHPQLFGWTLWIEVDAVSRNAGVVKRWHETMLPWLHQYDAGRHPVSTEFQNPQGYPAIWELPGIDFTQLAGYNWVYDPMLRLSEAARALERYPKPRLIEEYAGTSDGGSMALLATEIHDGLWGGWMLPLSATPMPWWWNFIFAKDLDRFYRSFARYIDGEDLRGGQPHLETLPLENGAGLEAWVRRGPDRADAWIRTRYVPAVDPATWSSWRPLPLKEEPARLPAFDPVSGTRPTRFAPVSGAVLVLRGLSPGRYTVARWETWGAEEVARGEATADAAGVLRLELPPLERDVALKVRKQP